MEKNGKYIEYYDNSNIKFIGEKLNGLKWNGLGFDKGGSLRYKIKNGKGYIKEYNEDDILIFEGDKSIGEGIEYDCNGKLIFEGEFVFDDRWEGKYKKYNGKGKLIFEGEYLNGKKHGKGKEYNDEGKLIFKGEYSNGFWWNGEWTVKKE